MAIGTIGYIVIEKWNFSDSFFMTVISVTTVGFGEINKLSEWGRFFTVFLIFSGFGLVAAVASQLAQMVMDGELKTELWKRKMGKRINKLDKHFIICGFGRVGQTVSIELTKRDIPVVVVEISPEKIKDIKEQGIPLVIGDIMEDETLLEAGIERAIGIISALPRDADNLLVALSSRELNHNLHIVCRGESSTIDSKLKRAGADVVVSPHQISGEYIADMLLAQTGQRLNRCLHCTGDHIGGYQLHAVTVDADAGKKIGELVKELKALGVVALDRDGSEKMINPPANTVLHPKDQLTILLQKELDHTAENQASGKPLITKKKLVLVVDDHEALRKLFVKKMKALGYKVDGAVNGRDALDKISTEKPNLLILDAMMPGMSGFDVCSIIKKDDELKDIKIIIFSNHDTSTLKTEGEKAGADAVLSKTAKSAELSALVKELLGE